MSTNDGGNAFPVADYDHMALSPKTVEEHERQLLGMSLRDYFAAKAMQSFISNEAIIRRHNESASAHKVEPDELMATSAYLVADAMLRAREADHE